MTDIKRFDVPTSGQSVLEIYRAMRAYFERVAKAKGQKLDPAWYDDGPDKMPWLYKNKQEDSPDATET